MKNIYVKEILHLLGPDAEVYGNSDNYFNNLQTADNVREDSLDWVNPLKTNKSQYISSSKAGVIICDRSVEIPDELLTKKCLIVVANPKLTFIRIANEFFLEKTEFGIHPSAVIHPQAEVHPKSFIGPNTHIGKSSIDEGTIVFGNCYIYDGVKIGKNVTIHAGCVIGADGFGYQRNDEGKFEKFPHIGGVIIEDHVEIGSNTCIDRGALGNTIIMEGAKIDNLVHIAHNVKVGKHSAVIANTMVGGSTVIGDYSWIAPSSSLRDQIAIGNETVIGMGSVVTKTVPDGETWTGAPAKPLSDFLDLQKKINNL